MNQYYINKLKLRYKQRKLIAIADVGVRFLKKRVRIDFVKNKTE